jgi:hypothetical protein
MSVTREELHSLIDRLDQDQLPSAATLLRELAGRRDKPRSRPSWAGMLRVGPDFAEQSDDLLRTGLGRPA